MRRNSKASENATDPCGRQQAGQIDAWILDHAAPGGIVVVMQSQRSLREYFLDEIVSLNLGRCRLVLSRHGRFDLAGRGMDAPRHALTLHMPTADLLAAAASGQTWFGGRPVFKRQLTLQETHLAGLVAGAKPA
ncbi:MAG TPA: hypothetical protein VE914_04195 [Candidatus Angelobacter sp.]|nr:hypothetical protein [Candidatus Angelobacter sp.]